MVDKRNTVNLLCKTVNVQEFFYMASIYGINIGETLNGTINDDYIFGFDGDDYLDGGDGNDYLDGGDGNDILVGGFGNDFLFGGLGNDIISGGGLNGGASGNDYVDGGDGNDFIVCGNGNDFIVGGLGNDSIDGGLGNDYLVGGDGNDFLFGGLGNDYLVGGSGADIFLFNSRNEGIDIITDFNFGQGDRILVSQGGFGASSLNQFSYDSITGGLFFQCNQFATVQSPINFAISSSIVLV
jgi:Ca2+-binding RTX toxin-like protein